MGHDLAVPVHPHPVHGGHPQQGGCYDSNQWLCCRGVKDCQGSGSFLEAACGSHPPRICLRGGLCGGGKGDEACAPPPRLLPQLLAVEGNPAGEEKLYSAWKKFGCLLIASVNFVDFPPRQQAPPQEKWKMAPSCCGMRRPGPSLGSPKVVQARGKVACDPELRRQMSLIGHLRSLMASRVWSEQVQLLKAEGPRFVAFSTSIISMLGAACRIAQLVAEFPDWLEVVSPELGGTREVQVRIVMEAGDMLPLPGDCFGDPAVTALKLSRISKPGELILGPQCMQAACANKALATLMVCLQLHATTADDAGTPMVFHQALIPALSRLLPPSQGFPCLDEMESFPRTEAVAKRVAVYVVDMGWAMRKVQRRGTLHCLRLVLSLQEIVSPVVDRFAGHIYKFDGEHAVVVFYSSDAALACVEGIWKGVAEYNMLRQDKDFHIHAGCALDYGEMVLKGYDLQGAPLQRAMRLAEDAIDKPEVLVTQQFMGELSGTRSDFCMYEEHVTEHSEAIRHCSVAFGV